MNNELFIIELLPIYHYGDLILNTARKKATIPLIENGKITIAI